MLRIERVAEGPTYLNPTFIRQIFKSGGHTVVELVGNEGPVGVITSEPPESIVNRLKDGRTNPSNPQP